MGSTTNTRFQEEQMIRLASMQLWCRDQDEALQFYTEKVGMEVKTDVTVAELGNFRWLVVGPPGQDDVGIVLMAIPGPPAFEPETVDLINAVMAKGVAGTAFLTTDDCRKSFEELRSRGVEFVEEPEDRPYGIDAGFRDPSGNHLRLTQVRELAGV
ncbi:MAG TPA: VOC family protein [Solirubrobacteraceae bacterium]|nr:VOC family protein [Solirubrobacteraceae bacterium]